MLSVALVVGSRPPGVTWHPALWSPDFPRRDCSRRDCLADSVAASVRAAAVAADANQRKGEFVLVVRGSEDDEAARLAEGRRLYAALSAHLKPSVAAKLAAELSGAPRKALYGGE